MKYQIKVYNNPKSGFKERNNKTQLNFHRINSGQGKGKIRILNIDKSRAY